jgi:hypothetical protein
LSCPLFPDSFIYRDFIKDFLIFPMMNFKKYFRSASINVPTGIIKTNYPDA